MFVEDSGLGCIEESRLRVYRDQIAGMLSVSFNRRIETTPSDDTPRIEAIRRKLILTVTLNCLSSTLHRKGVVEVDIS